MALSQQAATWLDDMIGAGWQARQLAGSTSTSLYRITAADQQAYVLRIYDNAPWLAQEPDLCPHEAAALAHMANAPLPTPELIASQPDADVPLLLMRYLPGEIVIESQDVGRWLRQMAEALTSIHQVPPDGFVWQYYNWYSLDNFAVPTWTRVPSAWEQLYVHLSQPRPTYKPRFIHRDYHPMNLLWQAGHISGVVDWINACVGPAAVDIAHMRMNLLLMFGIQMADDFLAAYQTANPYYVHDPYWDLNHIADFSYPGPPSVYSPWLEFGLSGLTDDLMIQRTDDFLQHVLKVLNRH